MNLSFSFPCLSVFLFSLMLKYWTRDTIIDLNNISHQKDTPSLFSLFYIVELNNQQYTSVPTSFYAFNKCLYLTKEGRDLKSSPIVLGTADKKINNPYFRLNQFLSHYAPKTCRTLGGVLQPIYFLSIESISILLQIEGTPPLPLDIASIR